MSRVSVSAGQKPKPKESFKFLRRDEGRLSYSAVAPESPCKGGSGSGDGSGDGSGVANRERRDSRALREAIAYDMRNAKSHDPLGEVVVAVPRKAPPPTRAASAPPTNAGEPERPPAAAPAQKRQPPRAVGPKKRAEWVGAGVPPSPPPPPQQQQGPTRSGPELESDSYADAVHSDPYSRGGAAAAAPPSVPARAASRGSDANGGDLGRYGGLTPRSAGVGAPRYAAVDYDDSSAAPSSAAERNYFRGPPYTRGTAGAAPSAPPAAGSRSREEDELIARLEQEISAAQEERDHYTHARQQLEREKQRFDAYRHGAQQQMEDERADADDRRSREQRDVQKDLRAVEERCKNISALLATERETSRRLTHENDSLRTQLEDLTSTMRETQSMHKAEAARMRRDIDSLTRRNAELLAMAKEQQLHSLDGAATTRQGSTSRNTAARDPTAYHAASPSYEDVVDDDGEREADGDVSASAHPGGDGERRASRGAAPPVMDFTPRAAAAEAAARERRSRQMQDRMQAEEEAMDDRRRQREQWVADRRREEQEKETRHRAAVAAAAAATARRQREEEEQRKTSAAATAEKPVEERKVSGHPVHTPRVQQSGAGAATAATVKRRPSASAPHPPVPPKRHRVPTREELVGDLEAPPAAKVANDGVVSQTAIGDNPNKKEVLYRSGKREIHYTNGTVKVVLPSGHTTLQFTNGDVKCTFPSGKSTYWYDAAQTMHTQRPDGVQTFEFRSTGQTERHQPDGSKEILYPDGIFKVVRPDGTDETYLPDGEPMEDD
ncbi:T-complex protein 10 C-terminus [Novymonas esmeraldas]|uniref:T-complex protein 10 C-terminus n=1 Tax=Novymonas esmeraldas TaxID=1808958 RepID=A0AAW0ETE2_9TRYP